MNTNAKIKPTKSVKRCIASLMTDIDPEIIPPIASPEIKTTDIIMTIMSFV